MSNSGLSLYVPQRRRKPPTDWTGVVSMCRGVATNWVSGRTLQPSIEPVVTNVSVPSDYIVDDKVSGLRTAHPLLTMSFFSTWTLPLFKRKTLWSEVVGLQKRERGKRISTIKWNECSLNINGSETAVYFGVDSVRIAP